MSSKINNAKCAQHMLDCTEGIDFPKTRNTVYGPEWISVKEKLPPENTYCLVALTVLFSEVKSSLFYDDSFFVSDEDVTKWVTHWIPLPKLPTDKSTKCPKCGEMRVADGMCWVIGCDYKEYKCST